jgi:hypothetical protein
MNASAATNSSSASQGVAVCKKSWFAVSIYKLDEKNKETYAEGVTIDLRIPEMGTIQRVTCSEVKPPMIIIQLNPGGKGDILQMKHDSDVYEAIGDFE